MGPKGLKPCCSANMIIASIVIVTKNQKSFLEKTLPILLDQKIKEQFEIIVVDSGSTDGAKEYVKKTGNIRLIEIQSENFNYAHAFNTGAAHAKGKYLIRLSGDCIPQGKDWLSQIVRPFKDPKVGGSFGKYILSGKKGFGHPDYWPSWRFPKKLTTYSIKPFWFMGAGLLNFSLGKNVYEFAGGCCAVRKEIWQKRPFNESLLAGEDAEYSWFLHIIGYNIVYNPYVKVVHEHKINVKKSAKTHLGITKWNWIFNITIWKYWINRLGGKDPYRDFVYKD